MAGLVQRLPPGTLPVSVLADHVAMLALLLDVKTEVGTSLAMDHLGIRWFPLIPSLPGRDCNISVFSR